VHELKNPLMLIGGFAQRLKKTVTGEGERRTLEVIATEVARLENLLAELREVYVPKSLSLEPLDVNEVLEDVYLLTRDACEKKRICATVEGDRGAPLVLGDREKLKQVVLNLVKNAMEAVGEGGSLSLASRATGEAVEVLITDNGPGIAKEQLEKVFNPFFTTKEQGSGLGLSICRRIVGEHDRCALSLESEEGRGTIAKISFPRYDPSGGERHVG